jgi:hypothetical protein
MEHQHKLLWTHLVTTTLPLQREVITKEQTRFFGKKNILINTSI